MIEYGSIIESPFMFEEVKMSRREQVAMQRVIEYSKTIENNYQFKIAAAIWYKGKLISVTHNELKSHPMQIHFGRHPEAISLHAETRVIHKALKILGKERLKKATLLVARVIPHHSKRQKKIGHLLANCKPCEGCSRCIENFGIKRVFYTLETGVNAL